MKRLLFSIMIISIILMSCRTTSNIEQDVSLDNTKYSIDKGKYESPSTTGAVVTFYTFTENTSNIIIKLKRIDITNKDTMYTIVYGIKDYNSSVTAFWDDGQSEYISYSYNDDGIRGIEIVYSTKTIMQKQDLYKNNIYLQYDNGEVLILTMPYNYWKAALDYVLH